MSKFTFSRISSMVNAPTAINGVITQIETALDSLLSRDGVSPNQMTANIDMNSNRVLNLPYPSDDFQPARLIDVTGLLAAVSGSPIPAGSIPNSALAVDTTNASNISSGTLPAARLPALSGDVTTSAGSAVTTIANDVVTNAKLAEVAAFSIKGNNTGSTANPTDMSGTQTTALLDNVVGDSGSGGTKGLVPAPASGDTAAGKYLKASGAYVRPPYIPTRRQTVIGGPITTGGVPNFLPATSVDLNLTSENITSSTPLFVTAAGGLDSNGIRDYFLNRTTNLTWSSLTASSTLYLYVNADTGATGFTNLVPVYQYYGTPSTTNNQFTFNFAEMLGYLGNGTTAVVTPIVFVGHCSTDGTTVTSTTEYAFNGYFESAYTATLPTTNTTVSTTHNLGVQPRYHNFIIQCTSAEFGYAIGEELGLGSFGSANVSNMPGVPVKSTSLVTSLHTAVTTAFVVNRFDTGANGNLTLASWKYKFVVDRGW